MKAKVQRSFSIPAETVSVHEEKADTAKVATKKTRVYAWRAWRWPQLAWEKANTNECNVKVVEHRDNCKLS